MTLLTFSLGIYLKGKKWCMLHNPPHTIEMPNRSRGDPTKGFAGTKGGGYLLTSKPLSSSDNSLDILLCLNQH